MEKSFLDFYLVVGTYEKDGQDHEYKQSVHLEYEKAYTQFMANNMSGVGTGQIKWRIDRYKGECRETVND
ncbi:hypothetical protein BEH_07775 [Priestia filamentosa]|uniref:Uncharacterized protein n=1 Tax=Priestia filamentosa TaxID=1402861 RepID=A0A0H4KUN1_9BACI|nr:hypothetical protein [Priestia filamentosa]AKO92008.1 hypothetical protein BEH_07775 [Priestia filamentosa]